MGFVQIYHFLSYCFLFFQVFGEQSFCQQLAFPTAEGYGKYATGGRGGKVIEVTNLNASGTGSLAAAIAASGKRTIVFRVSGTIDADLNIKNGDLTIAGQTAPGDGITLKGELKINASNLIIRYIRVRTDKSGDAMGGRYNDNIIVDHVSASWSTDEVMSIYHGNNVTIQWSMITEAMGGGHAFGGIWGNNHSTYHHNLIAHNVQRNPRIASGSGYNDLRNNVIYNWQSNSIYGGEKHQPGNSSFTGCWTNVVANYLKPGPGTLAKDAIKVCAPWSRPGEGGDSDYGKWYVADNYMYGNDSVTTDNWKGVVPISFNNDQEIWQLNKRSLVKLDWASEFMPINQQSAEDAYQAVLNDAGCSFPNRDAIDIRIIGEVRNGTATYSKGFISSPTNVGGWPVLNSLPALPDFDHDGMPNDWELANGLDSTDASDRNTVGPDGYTNLEIYLNSIISHPADVKESERIVPTEFNLEQNYPNPFNPSTNIRFSVPYKMKVRINVYDIMGRKIAELINEKKSAGTYEVNFAAKNLSSGVYIYQLEYSGKVISKKMLLIK